MSSSREAWVEDRWFGIDPETGRKVEKADHGKGSRWRARWVDPAGRAQAKRFARKIDAEQWLAEQTASILRADYVAPSSSRLTVAAWGQRWLEAYRSRRPSTVRQAEVHLKVIDRHIGSMLLADVKPTTVRSLMVALRAEGYADSYVYALHARLSQLMADAVHDGVLARNACSHRTSPGAPDARPYVATTAQVWAIHDAVPEGVQRAVLLGAFAGLRLAEACALRAEDVDFMRGIVTPQIQWGGLPLKCKTSRQAIPIPRELATMLATSAETVVCDAAGRPVAPWTVERGMRSARAALVDVPDGFRFHDLRHYYASSLLASGLDIKTVQTRMRHASAVTTLNTYGHLVEGADDRSRAAVEAMLAGRSAAG